MSFCKHTSAARQFSCAPAMQARGSERSAFTPEVLGFVKSVQSRPRASDPGFNSTYALLLSAYHAQATMRIAGEDSQLWLGSGGQYCRITFVGAT